ncbi:MAG: AAA family ATPase [Anaerolineales bacterium]
MSVITISRQLGSLGTTLGRKVAARLGYRLVHRELINRAAKLAGAPDMALAAIDELGLFGIELDKAQQRAYLQAVRDIIEMLAIEDNVVIVGRAGQSILQKDPDVLHLRVVAPLETRIQRIVEAHHVSPQAAKAQIEDSDRFRAQYLKRFYNIQWDDPSLYHLVINTGHISLEASAEVVCNAVHNIPNLSPLQESDLA